MSQHATQARNEGNGQWLPLTEYSVKSGVSLSTIRRKIKSNSIPFRLEKGKYFILFSDDESPNVQYVDAAPAPKVAPAVESPRPIPTQLWSANSNQNDGAVKMISEAFEHALSEKDQRLRLLEQRNQELEERLNELQLLVRVLEEKYEVRY